MRTPLIVLLASLASLLPSCATGSTQEGTEYVYRVNELIASVPHPIERTHAAAETVMRDEMGWVIESSAVDAFEGRITARGAGDTVRRVKLERKGDRLTEVRVHVAEGAFGSEDRARIVMSRIEERLQSMESGDAGGEG